MTEKPIQFAVMLFDIELPAGGGFQQALNDCEVISKIDSKLCSPIFVTNIKSNVERLKEFGKPVLYIRTSSVRKLLLWLRSKFVMAKANNLVSKVFGENYLDHFLSGLSVDLVHFVNPSRYASFLERHPYTTSVWDLCHRDEPSFPEVRSNREFERRESFYKSILPKAIAILVDSPESRQRLSLRYGVDTQRISTMPFLPAPRKQNAEIKDHSISSRYIFCPAQLWPHKNHSYILRALQVLKSRHNIVLEAIFCGGDRDGSRSRLEKYAEQLDVSQQIHWLGFVPDNEMYGLYKKALALVMPTYFGPTNLPPLEAFQYNTPVVYSDIEGAQNFLGDAALYADLADPSSLAKHLKNLIENPELKKDLIQKGDAQLKLIKSYDRTGEWERILKAYNSRLNCWRH